MKMNETFEMSYVNKHLNQIPMRVFDEIDLDMLCKIVAESYTKIKKEEISASELMMKTRKTKQREPRQMVMLIASSKHISEAMNTTQQKIGKYFGMNHATVCHVWKVLPPYILNEKTTHRIFHMIIHKLAKFAQVQKETA